MVLFIFSHFNSGSRSGGNRAVRSSLGRLILSSSAGARLRWRAGGLGRCAGATAESFSGCAAGPSPPTWRTGPTAGGTTSRTSEKPTALPAGRVCSAGQVAENLLTKKQAHWTGDAPPPLAPPHPRATTMSGRTDWRMALAAAALWVGAFAGSPRPDAAAAQPEKKPPAKDDAPALRAAAALYEGVRVETLDNGLRVYLKPVPGSAVVTTMVCYKVGSSDEDLDNTGLSHYLEHLMFKGTEKIKPGDIDRMTLRNGGHNNAYTSEDYTIFFFDFAADRWEGALGVEADRM